MTRRLERFLGFPKTKWGRSQTLQIGEIHPLPGDPLSPYGPWKTLTWACQDPVQISPLIIISSRIALPVPLTVSAHILIQYTIYGYNTANFRSISIFMHPHAFDHSLLERRSSWGREGPGNRSDWDKSRRELWFAFGIKGRNYPISPIHILFHSQKCSNLEGYLITLIVEWSVPTWIDMVLRHWESVSQQPSVPFCPHTMEEIHQFSHCRVWKPPEERCFLHCGEQGTQGSSSSVDGLIRKPDGIFSWVSTTNKRPARLHRHQELYGNYHISETRAYIIPSVGTWIKTAAKAWAGPKDLAEPPWLSAQAAPNQTCLLPLSGHHNSTFLSFFFSPSLPFFFILYMLGKEKKGKGEKRQNVGIYSRDQICLKCNCFC